MIKDITDQDREEYNSVVTHPLQSYEWGQFREKTGIKVIRKGLFEQDKIKETFTITIHPIPHTSQTIGYLPKCTNLSKEMLLELQKIGRENKCIFIQLEPNIIKAIIPNIKGELQIEQQKTFSDQRLTTYNLRLIPSAHPLFTKYTKLGVSPSWYMESFFL